MIQQACTGTPSVVCRTRTSKTCQAKNATTVNKRSNRPQPVPVSMPDDWKFGSNPDLSDLIDSIQGKDMSEEQPLSLGDTPVLRGTSGSVNARLPLNHPAGRCNAQGWHGGKSWVRRDVGLTLRAREPTSSAPTPPNASAAS